MSRPAKENSKSPKRTRATASSPEVRENQLILAATDLAEKQILEGTASAQVISHFLKLGSTREKLEKKKLETEIALSNAKIESLESAQRIEALYSDAIKAMRSYSGEESSSDEEQA